MMVFGNEPMKKGQSDSDATHCEIAHSEKYYPIMRELCTHNGDQCQKLFQVGIFWTQQHSFALSAFHADQQDWNALLPMLLFLLYQKCL